MTSYTGSTLDKQVQAYLIATHEAGGVVNSEFFSVYWLPNGLIFMKAANAASKPHVAHCKISAKIDDVSL